MNAEAKTSRDLAALAIVLVPPLCVGLLLVGAAADWTLGASNIRPELLNVVPAEWVDAPSPLGAEYNARSRRDHTEAYLSMLHAAAALDAKFASLSEVLVQRPNWFAQRDADPKLAGYVDAYLQAGEPILKRAIEIGSPEHEIWLPIEFRNPYGGFPARGSESFKRLLQIAFLSAAGEGNTERAMQLLQTPAGAPAADLGLLSDFFVDAIARAMTLPGWSTNQLESLMSMTDPRARLSAAWKQSETSRTLSKISWLLSGKTETTWRAEPLETISAPSRRLAWLRRQPQYASVSGVGTVRWVRKLDELQGRLLEQEKTNELDTTLQFPSYRASAFEPNMGRFAAGYVVIRYQHRFARTAVALRLYRLQQGRFPESLDQLAEVGLPRSETLDPRGAPLRYETTATGCRLGNASEVFSTVEPWSFVTPRSALMNDLELSLKSLLTEYRTLEFRDAAESTVEE